MDTPLLQTKLYIPPPPPGLLNRPRLSHQLNQALTIPDSIIVISAPAGYGKTTLLSSWIRAGDTPPVAWLTLEDEDSAPLRFVTYLLSALETLSPEAASRAKNLLQTFHTQPSIQSIFTEVVNVLVQNAQPMLIVLDDYHVIDCPEIHQGVDFLLHHLPPHLHLVIASRTIPPWAVARLRAQRRLIELRAGDLCFTLDEITGLFNQINKLALPADTIEALQNRTEGWIASLQLAALSMQQLNQEERQAFVASFTGSHHYIFDYLAEELFKKQSATDQQFLLQTSILDHLIAPLCATVTRQPDTQSILEHLNNANLLIAQDDNRQRYRYHPLFAGFLRQSLIQTTSQTEVASLYLRASQWCEANGYRNSAIQYAIDARAWDTVVRLMKTLAAPVQFMRLAQSWQRWIAALPETVWRTDKELCVGYAWAMMSTGRWQEGQQILAENATACRAENNGPMLGKVKIAQSYLMRMLGDIPAAMNLADQALKQLRPEDVHYRVSATRMLGINYLRMGKARASTEILTQAMTDIHHHHSDDDSIILGLVWLGQAQVAEGNLRQALNTRTEIFRLAETQRRDPPLISYVWAAMLYYEWNELDQAADHWKLALERQALLRNRSFPEYFVGLARLQWTQGEPQKAYATLEQALSFARQVNNEIAAGQITAQIIQFKLTQGDLDTGLAWLKAHPAHPDDEFVYFRQDDYLIRTRVLLHQRTPPTLAEAGQWLDKLLHHATSDGRQTDRVKILVLKAIAEAYSNNLDQALTTLNQALTLAEPENYIRTFLDEGQPLIELLHQAIKHDVVPTYAAHLLKAGRHAETTPPAPKALIPFSLSEREVEVLKLLSNYCSPQEISDSLIISLHTTRTHIKRIYRKLNVSSRKQAISTARKLNLV